MIRSSNSLAASRGRIAGFLAFAGFSVVAIAATATPLPQDGPCEFAFVAKPSVLLESDFVKQARFFPVRDSDDPVAILMREAKLVRGVIALPENISQMSDEEESTEPFQYYIEWTLGSDSAGSEYHDYVRMKNSGYPRFEFVREEQGKFLYSAVPLVIQPSPDAEPVERVPGYQIVFEGKRVVIASNRFQYQSGALPATTDSIGKLLKDNAKSDGFAVFDARSSRPLIDSAIRAGKTEFPPFVAPYLEKLERIDLVSAAVDVDESATATMMAECVRIEDAEEIAKMVEELVTMARFSNQGAGPAAEMNDMILDSIKSKATGRKVEVSCVLSPETARQTNKAASESLLMNNQKQAALAIHNFESVYGRFPFQPQEGQSEEVSWRVRVLPYLNEKEIHNRFDLSQSWDSPENLELLNEMPMPKVFAGIDDENDGKKTRLCWVKSGVGHFAEIRNGASNTICFVHGEKLVNWTENNDVTPAEVLAQFKSLKPGEYLIATFYDGSVRRIPAETDPAKLIEMLVPATDD